VLFRLGSGGGGDAAALSAALFARGGFDAVLADAHRELDLARAAAAELSAPELDRFIERRARYMTEMQTRIFVALFTGSVEVPLAHRREVP
jgi:hypothetical protein